MRNRMTGRMTWRMLGLCVLGVLALEGTAFAQGKTPEKKPEKKETGYDVMEFPADPLINALIDPNSEKITVGPKVVRVTLSRPRVSFVPELYKSIENL